jgi:hypothetical protein
LRLNTEGFGNNLTSIKSVLGVADGGAGGVADGGAGGVADGGAGGVADANDAGSDNAINVLAGEGDTSDSSASNTIGNIREVWGLVYVVSKTEGAMLVFEQDFTLEDAIGSHACSLVANMRVTNGIPLGSFLIITINYAETLKASVR